MFDAIKRVGLKLLTLPFDRPLPFPSTKEIELSGDLKDIFRHLSIAVADNMAPSEREWVTNAERLRELVLTSDPREFLRWDVIQATMFVTLGSFVGRELIFLRRRSDWQDRWRNALRESPIGRPVRCPIYPSSSGTLIQHAHHLAQFEEIAGTKIGDYRLIFEFGGGYGSMCRLCHNLGFTGKYVIFDLPHFSALQQYFLRSIGIAVHSVDAFRMADSGVCCISDLTQLESILPDKKILDHSLFVATWSLSEAPFSLRNEILRVADRFTAFLIAYQDRFHEVDNVEYFGKWTEKTNKKVDWHSWPIDHLPGNHYLVGNLRVRGANED